MAKVVGLVVLGIIAITALGPANWQPRTELGWELDHFIGYFTITLLLCLAWPRPLRVGGGLVAFAATLESLQALTPDRSPNFFAAFYSACGVFFAVFVAELFMRVRKR